MNHRPNDRSDFFGLSGKFAALLSVTEIGLGSLLHSLQIPLAGHFLSLNQGFILSRAVRSVSSRAAAIRMPVYISTSAALLKSLSPAGKKLTPMLAISVQGLLFSMGVLVLGGNWAGCVLGMVLLSIWGFAQPLLLAYLLFGKSFFKALELAGQSIGETLGIASVTWVWVALAVLLIKAIAAAGVALLAYRSSDAVVDNYWERLMRVSKTPKRPSDPSDSSFSRSAKLALSDIASPTFALCLGITAFFFVFAHSPLSTILWGLLRPIAVGYLLFLGVRLFPATRFVALLESWGFTGLSRTLARAIALLPLPSPESLVSPIRPAEERP